MTRETEGAMISEEQIAAVADRLRRAAPDATIILFGSHARGDAREDSDLDILVVEPALESRHAEAARLDAVLGDLGLPIDIVVTDEDAFREHVDESSTVYHDAARDGRVLHAPPSGRDATRRGEPAELESLMRVTRTGGWRRGAGALPDAAIRAIGDQLHQAAPEATIVLFGSYGRGDAREHSSVNILVIEPEVASALDETTRLADALGDTDVPVDLVVTDRATHERRKREAGALHYAAARDGRVLHGRA